MEGPEYGSVRFADDTGGEGGRRDGMQRSQSASGAALFLRTVKKVQVARRLDKLAKMRSESRLSYLREQQKQQGGEGMEDERNRLLASAGAAAPPPLSPSERSLASTTSTTQYLIQIICGKGVVSACLLAGPLALAANYFDWSDTAKFWLNFVTMIPLASILGDFTEEVALHTNETIGGLINATFGNAVEVVVAIQALLANEIRVVQSSMLGSIFSNLLLVLGGCFFFGGLKYKHQKFNATAASANMGLLALSAIALVLPTPFANYYQMHDEHVLLISRAAAVFLMFMYMQLLVFQLHTHAAVFAAEDDDDASTPGELANVSFGVSIAGLLVTTLLVTIFSEYLVDSIDGFTTASGISRTFVGIILLPIVGNAVEQYVLLYNVFLSSFHACIRFWRLFTHTKLWLCLFTVLRPSRSLGKTRWISPWELRLGPARKFLCLLSP